MARATRQPGSGKLSMRARCGACATRTARRCYTRSYQRQRLAAWREAVVRCTGCTAGTPAASCRRTESSLAVSRPSLNTSPITSRVSTSASARIGAGPRLHSRQPPASRFGSVSITHDGRPSGRPGPRGTPTHWRHAPRMGGPRDLDRKTCARGLGKFLRRFHRSCADGNEERRAHARNALTRDAPEDRA